MSNYYFDKYKKYKYKYEKLKNLKGGYMIGGVDGTITTETVSTSIPVTQVKATNINLPLTAIKPEVREPICVNPTSLIDNYKKQVKDYHDTTKLKSFKESTVVKGTGNKPSLDAGVMVQFKNQMLSDIDTFDKKSQEKIKLVNDQTNKTLDEYRNKIKLATEQKNNYNTSDVALQIVALQNQIEKLKTDYNNKMNNKINELENNLENINQKNQAQIKVFNTNANRLKEEYKNNVMNAINDYDNYIETTTKNLDNFLETRRTSLANGNEVTMANIIRTLQNLLAEAQVKIQKKFEETSAKIIKLREDFNNSISQTGGANNCINPVLLLTNYIDIVLKSFPDLDKKIDEKYKKSADKKAKRDILALKQNELLSIRKAVNDEYKWPERVGGKWNYLYSPPLGLSQNEWAIKWIEGGINTVFARYKDAEIAILNLYNTATFF